MEQKNKYNIRPLWLYTILICIIIDQLSKILIQINLIPYSTTNIISDILRFSYTENPGIAFGLNPFNNPIVLLLVSILAIYFIFKVLVDSSNNSSLTQFGLSLIIGGALGNFIDRFFSAFQIMDYQGVIDFIDVGINNHIRFPYVFNLADSFITIGISLYFISFIKIKFFNDK